MKAMRSRARGPSSFVSDAKIGVTRMGSMTMNSVTKALRNVAKAASMGSPPKSAFSLACAGGGAQEGEGGGPLLAPGLPCALRRRADK